MSLLRGEAWPRTFDHPPLPKCGIAEGAPPGLSPFPIYFPPRIKVSQNNFENLKARNHRLQEPDTPFSQTPRKISACKRSQVLGGTAAIAGLHFPIKGSSYLVDLKIAGILCHYAHIAKISLYFKILVSYSFWIPLLLKDHSKLDSIKCIIWIVLKRTAHRL